MKRLSQIFIPMLALAAIFLSACTGAAVPAGNPGGSKVDPALVDFTGVIESMNGNQWVVSGQTITVDPAVVRDSSFKVGDTVKVEAQVASDGSINVTRVEFPLAVDNSNDVNANINANTNDSNGNINSNTNDVNGNDNNSNSNATNGNDNSSVGINGNDNNSNTSINGNFNDNGNASNSNDDQGSDDNGGNGNGSDDGDDD